jgi:nucleoside-diphosphate-sugar epimerase
MVCKGFYVHPAGKNSQRNYGYVGNAVEQIAVLAAAPQANRGTFYIGDYTPIDVLDWANSISMQCGRPPVRELPAFLFDAAARVGDLMQALGMRDPPICSRRLNNLLTMAVYDLSRTRALCPDLPYDLEQGVEHTLAWLKTQ